MTVERGACVICGAPEPFGLSICADCGGQPHAVGDTLIFVKPGADARERWRVSEALRPLLKGRGHRSEQQMVAAGHRALIRVPAVTAERAVRHLAARDVPAIARLAARTWAPAPTSFYLLLASVVLVGITAGVSAEPMLRWTSPLVACLMLFAAQARLRDPVLRAPRRRGAFPRKTERCLIETFARLPDSEARTLLSNLVRSAEPLYRTLGRVRGVVTRRDIEELLHHGCRAAIDLSDLEVALVALEGEPGVERPRKLRRALAARIRDGITVLHRLRTEAVADDPTRVALDELLEALDADAKAFAAARSEIQSLLAPNQA